MKKLIWLLIFNQFSDFSQLFNSWHLVIIFALPYMFLFITICFFDKVGRASIVKKHVL